MFVPVNVLTEAMKEDDKWMSLYQYDANNSSDTKAFISRVNRGETIYVFSKDLDEAITACNSLNESVIKIQVYSDLPSSIKKVGDSSKFNSIGINRIKIYPLVMSGTQFTGNNGNHKIIAVENHLIGNVSVPYYKIQLPDGSVMVDVSQNTMLRYCGIQLPADSKRRFADIWVGDGIMEHLWTISLSKNKDSVYCMSPQTSASFSTDNYKWIRIYDQFKRNVLQFVESAMTRMVLELSGKWMLDKFVNRVAYNKHYKKDCYNCLACRQFSLSDTVLGDGVDPDIASKSTFDIKTDGSYVDRILCAYTMQSPGSSRIDTLREEEKIGSNTTGHQSTYEKNYQTEAESCTRYNDGGNDRNKAMINPLTNEVMRSENVITIRTAGIDVVFDVGGDPNSKKFRTLPKSESNPKAVCVTGHRPQDLGGFDPNNPTMTASREWLDKMVSKLIDEGYNHFISGMAIGIDTEFAKIVLKYKEKGHDIKLEAAIPCRSQDLKWTEEAREEYRAILEKCDVKTTVSTSLYTPDCMQKRNIYMVDKSSLVLAVWTEKQSGGTYNCIKYAKSKDVRVEIYNPLYNRFELKNGDILEAPENIIVHQVNCKGVMGAGLAQQIRNKYESAYLDYMKAYNNGELQLGEVVFSEIGTSKYIAHVCGQDDYGRDKQYTSYQGLEVALGKVQDLANAWGYTIAVPEGLGCGLGGASWPEVSDIIKRKLPLCTVYKKG